MPDLISTSHHADDDDDEVVDGGFVKVRQDSVSSHGSMELLKQQRSLEEDEALRRQQYNESDYAPSGAGSGNAEVLTEISSQGALKVSFVDHRKVRRDELWGGWLFTQAFASRITFLK